MTRFAAAVLACLGLAAPALAQEKTYVLDTGTGRVTQKDAEQDKLLAEHQKEIARLQSELSSIKEQVAGKSASPVVRATPVKTAPAVAAVDPFAPAPSLEPCPCGAAGCPFTADTTAPTAATPPPARGSSPAPDPFGAPTYTLAPRAAAGGITSGCASGNCAAPSFRPVRRLFGR